MTTDSIIAMIDGSAFSGPVLDMTAWAATRNDAPVRLLHVLPGRTPPKSDLSGAIRLGARTALLNELSELDERRARLAMTQGRAILDDATELLKRAGVTRITAQLRQGDLLDTVAAQESELGLIVIGKRGETADRAQGHLGSNFERIVRASRLPVLMAPRRTRPIERVTIAWDGGPSARRAVDRVARLPAYRGLSTELVTVGGPEAQASLDEPRRILAAAGIDATPRVIGTTADRTHPERALLQHLEQSGSDVLVMGAYGHSRIRTLMIGSTTTAILREAQLPVLLVR